VDAIRFASTLALHPLISRLVRRIDGDWRRAQFAASAFPDLCATALSDLELHRSFDAVEALQEFARGLHSDGAFVGEHGAPGIVPLFFGARFLVHLHVWSDNLGVPHSHAWSGAYQVLKGTCVTGLFSFDETDRLDPKVRLGSLQLRELGLQKPGSTAKVEAGPATIHGQSYADRPGLSISIRTREDWDFLTYNYWHPGLAIETAFVDDVTTRQLKSLDALYLLKPAECWKALRAALRRADARTTFYLLRHAEAHFAPELDVHGLRREAAGALGRHAPVMIQALASIERANVFEARRKVLRDWDHRFVCSLLFLAPDHRAMTRLIREQFPRRDPDAYLRDCIVSMASTPWEGGRSLLGTPLDSDLASILRLMLKDDRPEAVLKGLAHQYDAADVRAREPLVRRAIETIRVLPLLRPLFRPSHRPAAA
jgi:hypothetical protein